MRPVEQYRAASIAVLAGWLSRHPDEETRWRLIAEFLEEHRHEPREERLRLLSPEPPSVGDSRWDVFLAALAEHLAAKDGQAGPAWAETRRLRQFWFPFNTPAARVDAFVHSPASFRRRGVFIHPQELEVA
ncbi:hypothetical protein [Microbispora sp. ATCC PTA-5024]|uniref:hypothetical protein n=1 Tax=Microbispora sp. ATCC PTA-5024 TaxID=316330 RepID=UPI0012EE5733|nr:hypothetical protein [Microbispora sp. ATCC PTA-5024]